MNGFKNQSENNRRIESLLRLGQIAEIDFDKALVRVKSGNVLTDWLPWATLRAGKTITWSAPDIDEQCLILSTSGDLTTAVVLCGIYTADIYSAPSKDPDEHLIKFPDGVTVLYNSKSKQLEVKTPTKIIFDAENVEITGNLKVGKNAEIGKSVTAKEDVNANNVKAKIDVTAQNTSLTKHIHGVAGTQTTPPK